MFLSYILCIFGNPSPSGEGSEVVRVADRRSGRESSWETARRCRGAVRRRRVGLTHERNSRLPQEAEKTIMFSA